MRERKPQFSFRMNLMHTKPAYLALALYTRELLFFELGAGQLLCEGFNYVLKHAIKQERPNREFLFAM